MCDRGSTPCSQSSGSSHGGLPSIVKKLNRQSGHNTSRPSGRYGHSPQEHDRSPSPVAKSTAHPGHCRKPSHRSTPITSSHDWTSDAGTRTRGVCPGALGPFGPSCRSPNDAGAGERAACRWSASERGSAALRSFPSWRDAVTPSAGKAEAGSHPRGCNAVRGWSSSTRLKSGRVPRLPPGSASCLRGRRTRSRR